MHVNALVFTILAVEHGREMRIKGEKGKYTNSKGNIFEQFSRKWKFTYTVI